MFEAVMLYIRKTDLVVGFERDYVYSLELKVKKVPLIHLEYMV